jgi:hypothetical protein
VLGGAQAAVAGAPGGAVDLGDVDLGAPLDTGTPSLDLPPAAVGPDGLSAPQDAGEAEDDGVALDTTPAFDIAGTPVRPVTALLGLAAAALLAIGMRRLGTSMLDDVPLAAACPLGDDG